MCGVKAPTDGRLAPNAPSDTRALRRGGFETSASPQ